jgi:acetolactate synthase-1/2/3 large subunit
MTSPGEPRYGSDVIVDAIRAIGLRYAAFNPGASFRGLHDSLVNREGAPELITCPHEKLAVQLAHGYAKATGEPMVAILHNVVGLLHGTLGLLEAYLDRVPVVVLGGSGPADTERRRPWIDWIHTAHVQGDAIRGFTKWDAEPASIAAIPSALARARTVALTEPAGPVYVALDADLQERPLDGPVPSVDWARVGPASGLAPDPAALGRLADDLAAAARPVLVAGYAGRDPRAFEWIPALAEALGAAVVDLNDRLNIATTHPLNLTGTDLLGDADVVLLVDVKDGSRALLEGDQSTRTTRSRLADGARVYDLGLADLHVRPWLQDFGPLLPFEGRITADTTLALPLLLDAVRSRIADEAPARAAERGARREDLARRHAERRATWRAAAERRWDERPISPPRLAAEVWEVIREHDWVLTAGTADDWARRLWDFDRPYRHPGRSLGTATQIGISLGVALAHRGTGRLVVDLQPDGDLMFDPGALWVAAAHRLPFLAVMVNNRAYYNDWAHQVRIAGERGSDLAKAHVGVSIDDPAPDFATIARGFGWWAEGPVEDPAAIGPAVRRAARVVLEEGRPALVDVVTAHR